jgi:hypothetical protein
MFTAVTVMRGFQAKRFEDLNRPFNAKIDINSLVGTQKSMGSVAEKSDLVFWPKFKLEFDSSKTVKCVFCNSRRRHV